MRIGMALPHWTGGMAGQTPQASEIVDFGVKAEEAGLDSLWLTDHIYHEMFLDFQAHGYDLPEEMRGVRSGFWECWTLLSALAARTERVGLGTVVTNTAFRNPALLANMVETVDSLSDGRVILGLGAGDFYSEHRFLGYPWEYRVSRFEEALRILVPMLRGEQVTVDGTYYRAETAELLPRGPRPTGPPILVGSMKAGPRMMRLTAEFADGWTCWLAFEDSHAGNFAKRKRMADDAIVSRGRDPDSLRTTVVISVGMPGVTSFVPGANPITGAPNEVAREMHRYAELGVDDLAVFLQPATAAGLEWFSEVLDHVRKPV